MSEQRPLAVAVFRKHGIDPGANDTVASACASAEREMGTVEGDLERAEHDLIEAWSARPLGLLIDHVIDAYHQPMRDQLDVAERELVALGADREVIERLAGLREELLQHVAKEEVVLFPWLASGRGRTAAGPIRVMQLEHGESLGRLIDLRAAVTALGGATPGLESLEQTLCEHIFLENAVLFPRALAA